MNVLLTVGVLYCVVVFWYVPNYVVQSNPDINTFYSVNYRQDDFKTISKGMNINAVKNTLGEPLSVKKVNPIHRLLYSADKLMLLDNGVVSGISDVFLRIDFINNKVSHYWNKNYKPESLLGDLIGKTYSDVLNKLGQPIDEVNIPAGELYEYSALVDGYKTGKLPTIHLKRVFFVNNKVYKVVDMVGNPDSIYAGLR